MKVAILVFKFLPRWVGGSEITTYNIAECLARRGHEIHVITSWDKGLQINSIEAGFHVHRVRVTRVKFLHMILFWIQTLLVVRKISPDIIHVLSIKIGLGALMTKRLFKTPYVIWGQGSDVYCFWLFKRIISKLVLKNADAVIALTEHMGKHMLKLGAHQFVTIPPGTKFIKPENLYRENARLKLNLETDETAVLFVGRLDPIKGLKYLVQAMSIVVNQNQKTRLLLAGSGSEKQKLDDLVNKLKLTDKVNFLGNIANENVPEVMIAADIFVLPSLSEGFAIVVVEAMACGLPIVASSVRGLPEIIKDGENGFLVEPQQPEQIAEKIIILMHDSELRKKISQSNHSKAKDYNWNDIAGRLEKVYYMVSSKPK